MSGDGWAPAPPTPGYEDYACNGHWIRASDGAELWQVVDTPIARAVDAVGLWYCEDRDGRQTEKHRLPADAIAELDDWAAYSSGEPPRDGVYSVRMRGTKRAYKCRWSHSPPGWKLDTGLPHTQPIAWLPDLEWRRVDVAQETEAPSHGPAIWHDREPPADISHFEVRGMPSGEPLHVWRDGAGFRLGIAPGCAGARVAPGCWPDNWQWREVEPARVAHPFEGYVHPDVHDAMKRQLQKTEVSRAAAVALLDPWQAFGQEQAWTANMPAGAAVWAAGIEEGRRLEREERAAREEARAEKERAEAEDPSQGWGGFADWSRAMNSGLPVPVIWGHATIRRGGVYRHDETWGVWCVPTARGGEVLTTAVARAIWHRCATWGERMHAGRELRTGPESVQECGCATRRTGDRIEVVLCAEHAAEHMEAERVLQVSVGYEIPDSFEVPMVPRSALSLEMEEERIRIAYRSTDGPPEAHTVSVGEGFEMVSVLDVTCTIGEGEPLNIPAHHKLAKPMDSRTFTITTPTGEVLREVTG